VQREVVARTDLLDCRVHEKTWELLRLTRMPAVRLEVGHVTLAGDAARLSDPAFRDTVAEAVLVAVQRLYLPADLDPADRVMRLPDFAEALGAGR
jgi:N-acetylmuramoyl-L-alanine amidase